MSDALPACGFTLSGKPCEAVGNHFCENRANHAKTFIEGFLVHTKGRYARTAFKLRDWQFNDIVAPIFGTTEWSEEHNCYRRQYSIAWIEIARKNGKSELLAALMLYIMFCEGEFSAELFSVATDRKQAGAIFDVALKMVLLNPKLAGLCKPVESQKRLVYKKNSSVYQVLANDAGSALGSNPSAVAADEILAWPNGGMWTALRSGMGSMARVQPLFIAATTAGNDSESFGGQEHREMKAILDDPSRAPHIFVYMRNTPMNADPFDESTWHYANPALGDFLSIEEMRKMALEAKNNPAKLNGFRQFQLNQWVSSSVAWMPMHMWDESAGTKFKDLESCLNAFAGRECWFGMDLSAVSDLTSICYVFPDDYGGLDAVWRHYCSESALRRLDKFNEGRFSNEFVRDGWLTVTPGNILEFERVYQDVERDAQRFQILGGDADQWSTYPVIQEIESRTYVGEINAYVNKFSTMSDGMHRVFNLVTDQKFRHHGNPLTRFCVDACEAKINASDPDLIMPQKQDRNAMAKRIDSVPAAIMAVNAWWTRGYHFDSIYATDDVLIL